MNNRGDTNPTSNEPGTPQRKSGSRFDAMRTWFFERLLKPKLSVLDMLLMTAYCGSFVLALLLTYLLLSSSLVSLFLA